MCDTAEHHASTAMLPDYTQGVSLVGQSNPINPNKNFGAYADLCAEGNLVAIGTQQGTGVAIVDIANPNAPTFQSYYNPSDGGKFKDLVIKDKIGYFALDNNGSSTPKGIHIVDLSNPTQPREIGRIRGSQSFQHNHNIFVDGDYLYAAPNDQPKIRVYDISNPASPQYVREFATTGSSTHNLHDLTVRNGKLYTSNIDNGITDVFNITDVAAADWTAAANKIASFKSVRATTPTTSRATATSSSAVARPATATARSGACWSRARR